MVVDQDLVGIAQTLGHGFEHRMLGVEFRLLRDIGQLHPRRAPHTAIVGLRRTGNDLEQAGFAGAVAADQADPFARLQHQVGVVEQRHMAERERYFI